MKQSDNIIDVAVAEANLTLAVSELKVDLNFCTCVAHTFPEMRAHNLWVAFWHVP